MPVLKSVLKYLLNKLSLCSVLTCSEILFYTLVKNPIFTWVSGGLKREHHGLFQVSDWSCGSGSLSLCSGQILGRLRAFLQLCPAAWFMWRREGWVEVGALVYIKVREKQGRCESSQDDTYRRGGKREIRGGLVGLVVLTNQTVVGRSRLLPFFYWVE